MLFSTPILDEQGGGGGEPASFGGQLKALREARSLSIEEVARATNIKPETLEAIEAGTILEHTPPTYARGFLRIYAEHVEADLDRIMEDFDRHRPAECARFYVKGVGTMTHKDYRPGGHRRRPSPARIPSIVLLILLVCVGAAYIYVHFNDWLGLGKKASEPAPSADSSTTFPAAATPETPAAVDMPFVLRVSAEENTAIKAEVDGTLVANEVLKKGDSKDWKGKKSVRLELPDPSSVRISRDGEPIAEDLGVGPVIITLDETGLKISPLGEN